LISLNPLGSNAGMIISITVIIDRSRGVLHAKLAPLLVVRLLGCHLCLAAIPTIQTDSLSPTAYHYRLPGHPIIASLGHQLGLCPFLNYIVAPQSPAGSDIRLLIV
jgi:hypothetical protein